MSVTGNPDRDDFLVGAELVDDFRAWCSREDRDPGAIETFSRYIDLVMERRAPLVLAHLQEFR